MQTAYRDLLLCYMNRSYVMKTKLSEIDPCDSNAFIPDAQMYLGVEVLKEVQKPEIYEHTDTLRDFYHRCRQFLQIGCQEFKKRYNFDDTVLPLLSLLSPKKALSNDERTTTPSLVPLIVQLPRIVDSANSELVQKIDDEW